MSVAKRTLRNTALLSSFELANPLLSLFLIGTLSRILGAQGLGAYNLLLNTFFVVHSFTSLGLNALITREVSRERKSAVSYLCSSCVLGLGVSLVAAVATVFALDLAGFGPEIAHCGWWVGLSLFPSIVLLYSESIFVAFEKIHLIVYLALLENVLRVLAGLWLVRSGFGVESLLVSFTILRYVALALNLVVFNWQVCPLTWRFERSLMATLARNVPVFGTILVVATLYLRADVFILSKMAGLAAVGYYSAGYRIFAIMQSIPKSYNTSVFPVLANFFTKSQAAFVRAKSLSIRYMLVLLFPIAAGVCGLAEPVVRLLFGKEFGPAIPVLRVVIWTLVPYGITRVVASSLFASGRQIIDLKVNVLGLTANIILNVVMIGRYGALGCAWATFISSCVFLVCQIYYLRREILPVLREAEMFKPALAAGVVVLWVSMTGTLPLPVRIIGGAGLYCTLILLLHAVSLQELRMVLPGRFGAGVRGVGES